MSVMLDLVGAAIFVGVIMVTILTLNANLTAETYKSVSTLSVQSEAIQLSRIIEFDLHKAGYDVAKPKIALAETSHLVFKANLRDSPGSTDLVEYLLGAPNSGSTNPNDKRLARYENSAVVFVSYSVTNFKFLYFDSLNAPLAAPLSASNRDKVRSIKVQFNMESPEPFTSAYHIDSTYAGAYYEKLIFPRNLQ